MWAHILGRYACGTVGNLFVDKLWFGPTLGIVSQRLESAFAESRG